MGAIIETRIQILREEEDGIVHNYWIEYVQNDYLNNLSFEIILWLTKYQ